MAILQRPGAAVFDKYLSSRSPPDHLLYHMLKMVPVCGGGSDFMVEGSTCGRAGRRLRRRIVLVFLGWEMLSSVVVGGMSEVELLVGVRAALGSGLWRSEDEGDEGEGIIEGMMGGIEVSTSDMLSMNETGIWGRWRLRTEEIVSRAR